MPARGILNWNPTGSESLEIEEGYYEGGTIHTQGVWNAAWEEARKDVTGTATEADILEGYTAYTSKGPITGTMKARGILNWNPTGKETKQLAEGYYEGGTLRTDAVWDNGYKAGVTAGEKSAAPTGNAGVGDVLAGKTFSNASGKGLTGTMANRGILNWSGVNSTTSVQAGYYIGGTLDSRPSYTSGYNKRSR